MPPQFGGHQEPPAPLYTIPSIRFGAGFLARTFSRFVKDLVDIATSISDGKIGKVRERERGRGGRGERRDRERGRRRGTR